jgi:predicted ATP-grasp superfamily ATP-dependent carboligase
VPRPRIAVVGASVRGAAFSLLRAGCEVVAADLFADADLQRVCSATRITDYPDDLAAWLADTSCDGWLYTGALENHPELVDRMASLRPLLGNRGEVLRRVRDPLVLQHVLMSAGLNFPETKLCDGMYPGEGKWLLKTGQGGNGSGVTRESEPLGLSPWSSGYWQREIKGTPGSTQYLAEANGTCTLIGITRQLVGEAWYGASEFQYCGTLAPWDLPAAAELTEVGRALTAQFGLRGLFGVDFVFDGERPWIVEVNPRITAAMEVVERVVGRHLLAEHLHKFGIEVGQHDMVRVPAAGKVVLYAKHPLAVSRQLSEQLLTIAGRINLPQFADIPVPNTQISLGDPILTIFAVGDDLAAVESELCNWVIILEGTLYRDSGGS